MRAFRAFFAACAMGGALLLAGCGGGASLDIVIDGSPPPAFDIIMFVNGAQVPGVRLEPGLVQDIQLPAGYSFELATSGPVIWTVAAGGQVLNPPVGGTIVYAGINVTPTNITNARYAANTNRVGVLSNPVTVSFIVSSRDNPNQIAQINIVLTN